jgi:hypothetical protein
VTRITWDGANRPYSRGVQNGVLYPQNSPGVAWNGLVSVTEKGDDAPAVQYLEGMPYNNHFPLDVFQGTITAFTYPEEFEIYNGVDTGVTAQSRSTFGFSWCDNRELHIVYQASIGPSSDQYSSLGDTPNPVAFAWPVTTIPVDVQGSRPTSHLIVSLDFVGTAAMDLLQAALYGDDENDPYLPDVPAVIEMFESSTLVRITDNGDGTWTATGPDELVFIDPDNFIYNAGDTFVVTADTVITLNEGSYIISSSNS